MYDTCLFMHYVTLGAEGYLKRVFQIGPDIEERTFEYVFIFQHSILFTQTHLIHVPSHLSP